jgi:aryl-alcohol dehydrogenase-like predicted oxidoreductase
MSDFPLPSRRLGGSTIEVTAVGLGCNNFGWRLDAEATATVLEAALAAGIAFFDTADIYGGAGESERLMGLALEGRRGEPAPAGTRLAGGEVASAVQFDAIEGLEAFARERGIELIDVAIGGLAAQPAVASVIAGATRPEQIAANVAGARWQPSEDDLAALDRIAPAGRR